MFESLGSAYGFEHKITEWANGREMVEDDLEITHDLGMDLRGYCNLECCNDYE